MPHHRQRQAKTRTPDLAWNEPFKAKVTEKYDVWMANGAHLFTAAGNNCVAHEEAAPDSSLIELSDDNIEVD